MSSSTVTVFENVTAVLAAPTAATDGVEIDSDWSAVDFTVAGTGSGTPTATVRIWGYKPKVDLWFPLAYLNNGDPVPESSTGVIRFAEPFDNLYPYSRIAGEVTAVGGTITDLDLTASQGGLTNRG